MIHVKAPDVFLYITCRSQRETTKGSAQREDQKSTFKIISLYLKSEVGDVPPSLNYYNFSP